MNLLELAYLEILITAGIHKCKTNQALLEYALNIISIQNASHEEKNLTASTKVIRQLNCSLVGESQTIEEYEQTFTKV